MSAHPFADTAHPDSTPPLAAADAGALLRYRDGINAALERFFVALPDMLPADLSPDAHDALAKLREYTLRPGKRIRGALAAAAYDQAAGTALGAPGLAIGVALELLQSYLLIIDDVMDRSVSRRGQPTVHRLYMQEPGRRITPREADMLAVNVGLIAQHAANLALLAAPETPAHIASALRQVHTNIAATGFGQLDDLVQTPQRPVRRAAVIRKYRLKSSYYTFINPLQAGLALAGKDDGPLQERVERFGAAAGIAFQLHDDYLGIFGTAATGKPNTDDIREGKYTLLMQHALAHAAPDDARTLRRLLGNPRVGQAGVRHVRAILERSGAKAFATTEAQRYAQAAARELPGVRLGEPLQSFLAALLAYAVSRIS